MSIRVTDAVAAHLAEQFAEYRRDEAAITFLGAEPLRVLRCVPQVGAASPSGSGDSCGRDDVVWYCSVGCSAQPMDPASLDPDPGAPRAEVVIGLRRGVDAVLRSLAVVAASPAVEGVVLAEGLLLDLGSPLWPGAAFVGVILQGAAVPPLAGDWGADVRFLQAVPVTQTEAAWVRLRGADALREAWDEAGVDVLNPDRSAVSLG